MIANVQFKRGWENMLPSDVKENDDQKSELRLHIESQLKAHVANAGIRAGKDEATARCCWGGKLVSAKTNITFISNVSRVVEQVTLLVSDVAICDTTFSYI